MGALFRKDIRLQISIAAPLCLMLVFTLARVALWLGNASFFAVLEPAELATAFIQVGS